MCEKYIIVIVLITVSFVSALLAESIGDHVLTDESDLKNSISKLVPIRKLIERRYNRESPTTMEDISYMDKLIRLAYSMPHVKDMKNKAMNFVDLKSGIRFKKSKEYNIYDKLYQSCCDED